MNRQLWVCDIETLKSCFTYTAINVDTEEIVQYVLHKDRWELDGLIEHLNKCKGQIGFNNINFDYPVIHLILNAWRRWVAYLEDSNITKEEIILEIYEKAQQIIETQDTKEFYKTVAIPVKQWKIQQLDLFKLWHYNNKARRTSLKALEISMNYPNVVEMPIDHKRDDIKLEEVPSILEYNLNDVLATFEFYKRSGEKIKLRRDLIEQYNLPCINFPDSKIGEQLVLKQYCNKTGKDYWDVKEQRTYRSSINLGECIFDYIEFESKEFNNLLKDLKNTTIKSTKGEFERIVNYKGFQYVIALGGIHGCIRPGIYESNDEYVIMDLDVASLYPSIAIKNNLFPAHLGHDFCKVYETILKERIVAKKAGNMALSDGLKLALNAAYGKSNEINSFLYDPKYTMQTTINGQLMLCMLAERIAQFMDGQVLQINTDGLTVRINIKDLDGYHNICKDWEKETKLELEFVEYSKMIIRDVNNYSSVTTKGKIKNKGCFEVDKVVGNERAYHKDNSFRIIPLALQEYFIKGIPIENTIKNHRNIYDFCGRQKFTKDSYGMVHFLENDEEKIEKQQKNVRYYISKPGATFVKYYSKGTSELINKGYEVTIFNNFIEKEWKDYNINYSFYIKEAMKIVEVIEDKQLQLNLI